MSTIAFVVPAAEDTATESAGYSEGIIAFAPSAASTLSAYRLTIQFASDLRVLQPLFRSIRFI